MLSNYKSIPSVGDLLSMLSYRRTYIDANLEYVNRTILSYNDYTDTFHYEFYGNLGYIVTVNFLHEKSHNTIDILSSITVCDVSPETIKTYICNDMNNEVKLEYSIIRDNESIIFRYNYSISDSYLDGKNVYFEILARYSYHQS